jgi:hypothetical protein
MSIEKRYFTSDLSILYASLTFWMGMTSTSAVIGCAPQKSSISWVSGIPPMLEPAMRVLLLPAHSSSVPLSLPLFPSLHKNVVRDGVPSIVNADEEQEQRRSAHEEQGRARLGGSRACRYGKHCVGSKWKQNMK